METKTHDCNGELERRYPQHAQANDGERWTCSCGKVWEHTCDEAEGCYWVERVINVRNATLLAKGAAKKRFEAQRVAAPRSASDKRKYAK